MLSGMFLHNVDSGEICISLSILALSRLNNNIEVKANNRNLPKCTPRERINNYVQHEPQLRSRAETTDNERLASCGSSKPVISLRVIAALD